MHLNQIERQEKETAAKCAVKQERQHVRTGERARAKQGERQHRLRFASLDPDERNQRDDACDQRADDERMRPALFRRLDHRVDDPAESERDEESAAPIDLPACFRIDAFRDVAKREIDDCDRQRNIDEERRAPRKLIDQKTAENWTECRHQRRCAGPRANRLAAVLHVERCADDREASRHQQRRADALQRARGDQLSNGRGESASDRRHREHGDPDDEYAAAPEAVACGTTRQQQGREKERVRFDDPQGVDETGRQLTLECRQRDVHHRPVDEGHARRDNRGDEDPRSGARGRRCEAGRGADDRCIARCRCVRAHSGIPLERPFRSTLRPSNEFLAQAAYRNPFGITMRSPIRNRPSISNASPAAGTAPASSIALSLSASPVTMRSP